MRVQSMKGWGFYRLMGGLVKEARAGRIDVVHTHLTRAAYFGHSFGLLTGVPIVTSVHIANNDNIYRRLARKSNRLVAVSDFVRGMLHGRGVPESYITTVHNGTDMLDHAPSDSRAVRAALGIPAERQVVAMIGRVSPEKGHPEMVRALARGSMGERRDAHLLFVGRFDPGYEPEIRTSVRDLGLTTRVTFAGERGDVAAMLDASAMAAMPSVMETFGVAAIEAMARGRAVVATRVGGLPEVVRDGRTGLLVDFDSDEIGDAVEELLADPVRRKAMGDAGRDVVRAEFTLEKMARRFELVYAKAFAGAA